MRPAGEQAGLPERWLSLSRPHAPSAERRAGRQLGLALRRRRGTRWLKELSRRDSNRVRWSKIPCVLPLSSLPRPDPQMPGLCCSGGAERERGWEIEPEALFSWERLGSTRHDGAAAGGWACSAALPAIRQRPRHRDSPLASAYGPGVTCHLLRHMSLERRFLKREMKV